VTKREFVNTYKSIKTTKQLAEFFKKNIRSVCTDPRTNNLAYLAPFSGIYFSLDQNGDRKIRPKEVQKFFKMLDSNKNGKVSKKEFTKFTSEVFLSYCY